MQNNRTDHLDLMSSIIETAIDGIIVMRNDGIMKIANTSAAQLFGYEKSELLGQNVAMLMNDPQRSEHHKYVQRYERTGERKVIGIGRETLGLRKNGESFPIRLAVSEVKNNGQSWYTGVIHDLTDIKRAETNILALNKELEAKVEQRTTELERAIDKLISINNALENEIVIRKAGEEQLKNNEKGLKSALERERELHELKSRFVSMASHEFRTPLTTILSSVSLIAKYEETDQQPNRLKHINRIRKTVSNLSSILNDFLSTGSLEEKQLVASISEVHLDTLCADVAYDMNGMLKKKQFIQIDVPNLVIRTDQQIMRNILFNLLSNAIKYSDEDVVLRAQVTEDGLKISIQDFGIGIPKEDQKHLFTRFFRAKNAIHIPGTGLGLNIVREYLTLFNGDIQVLSKLGIGSKFTITLPADIVI